MKDNLYISDLRNGAGTLKYYKYWTCGILLRSKKDVYKAIELKLKVFRQDKITKEVFLFDYKTMSFKKSNKGW